MLLPTPRTGEGAFVEWMEVGAAISVQSQIYLKIIQKKMWEPLSALVAAVFPSLEAVSTATGWKCIFPLGGSQNHVMNRAWRFEEKSPELCN